jgi:filamentous hemagglutinin family protein
MRFFQKALRKITKLSFLTYIVSLFVPHSAFCLPQIDKVVSGSADVSRPNGSTLQINATDKTIINYKSFDIGKNESVIFNLPRRTSEILNRVISGTYSSIVGTLKSNGIVFLINGNGLVFGPTADVHVAGLVASTRDISNGDFLSSKYNFRKTNKNGKDRDSVLLNEGKINVANNGFAVFVAGAIENKGAIACPVGRVAMAAGDAVRIGLPGDGNVSVTVDRKTAGTVYDTNGKPVTDQIKNTGNINADGGVVLLKSESLPDILSKAVNMDGVVRADKTKRNGGAVELVSNKKTEGKDSAVKSASNGASRPTAIKLGDKINGAISSTGTLKTGLLEEEGASFLLGGTSDVKEAHIRNKDRAVTYSTGSYSGTYADIDNIIINTGAVITLKGATTFKADSNLSGTGYVNMSSGSGIVGNGNDLFVYASQASTLRAINGVRYLNLYASKSGSNPTFTANNKIALTGGRAKLNYCVLNMNHNDLNAQARVMYTSATMRNVNYYVDATAGDDNIGGTSPEVPWKTLNRINGAYAALKGGDRVAFKRGQIWRGVIGAKSGDSTGDVTYTAYGTGAAPQILGSLSFKGTAGWTSVGSNVWQKSGTFLDIGNLIFNNEASTGVKKWSKSDLKAQGDFYYDRGSKAFFMYSTSNPGTYYSNIEAAQRQNCIHIDNQSHVTIEDLDLRYTGSHGIGGANSSYITVQDNHLAFIGGSDQYLNGSNVRYGNGIEFYENAHDTVVRRNRIDQVYDAGMTTQANSDGNSKYNQYFYDNIVTRAEYGWEYFNITPNGQSNTHNIYVENNTFADAGKGWGHNQRPTKKGTDILMSLDNGTLSNFYIRNNIAKNATEQVLGVNSSTDLPYITFDNNLYDTTTGSLIKVENKGTYAFSTWKSTYGKDAHSLNADPLVTSDYHLTSSSPAINKALTLSYITTDFAKKARPSGFYDIGAYEY